MGFNHGEHEGHEEFFGSIIYPDKSIATTAPKRKGLKDNR